MALRRREQRERRYSRGRPVCARCGEVIWEERCHAMDGDYYCCQCWDHGFSVTLGDEE